METLLLLLRVIQDQEGELRQWMTNPYSFAEQTFGHWKYNGCSLTLSCPYLFSSVEAMGNGDYMELLLLLVLASSLSCADYFVGKNNFAMTPFGFISELLCLLAWFCLLRILFLDSVIFFFFSYVLGPHSCSASAALLDYPSSMFFTFKQSLLCYLFGFPEEIWRDICYWIFRINISKLLKYFIL